MARRRNRISRSGDFDAVYRRGTSAVGRHLVVYAVDREDGRPARLGLSVSKKVGGAVERNRIKRVLREQFASLDPGPPDGADVVVIARPSVATYLDENGSEAIGERLASLVEDATRAMTA